jgi:hypothetical protein
MIADDKNILYSFPLKLGLFVFSVAYMAHFTCKTTTIGTDIGLFILVIVTIITALIVRLCNSKN